MKKYFVSSDIHSFYDEWMAALKGAGFDINNKEHCIIVNGDLLDRGPKPKECLKFVCDLHKQGRAILIKGNHEYLLEEIFNRRYFERHDEHNGTLRTCELISGEEVTNADWRWHEHVKKAIEGTKEDEDLKYYLDNVVDYYETDKYIFVHGWIPTGNKEVQDSKLWYHTEPDYLNNWREIGDFEEATWLNGMYQWKLGIREPGKTIVCGHWHTSWGHSNLHNKGVEFITRETLVDNMLFNRKLPKVYHTPFKDDGIIALDACTAVSEKVNVVVLCKGMKKGV